MSDGPKKPLPFSAAIPGTVPSGPVPDQVRAALMALLADTLNTGAILKTYDIPNATYEGRELGTWKITVAQVG